MVPYGNFAKLNSLICPLFWELFTNNDTFFVWKMFSTPPFIKLPEIQKKFCLRLAKF